METSKYGQYIITDTEPNKPELADTRTRLLYLGDDVVKGAFWLSLAWYTKGPFEAVPTSHTHEFDEILAFLGTDPENKHDLGGEVELYLGDEKHTLNQSCLVFIPKGLSHCPLIVKRIDRPLIHFSTGPINTYEKA